jgi:hypothetical protein
MSRMRIAATIARVFISASLLSVATSILAAVWAFVVVRAPALAAASCDVPEPDTDSSRLAWLSLVA